MRGPPWKDRSPHDARFTEVNGVRMNYLDWGGRGDPLILIHGYGDNPHIFDDFAPAFTDRYRVVAYARRAHGLTESKRPYDSETLANDLRGFMRQLRIPSAHLAGWSMGGNEITSIAGSHPECVSKIVYLDAAYDWSDSSLHAALETFPIDPRPPASAMQSWSSYLTWHHEMMFPALKSIGRVEAYLREMAVEQPDGALKMRMLSEAASALWKGLLESHKDYTRVNSPVLAIYSTTFMDLEHGDPDLRSKFRNWEENYFGPFRGVSMQKLRTELSNSEVLTVPGTHTDFVLTSREKVSKAIIEFLSD